MQPLEFNVISSNFPLDFSLNSTTGILSGSAQSALSLQIKVNVSSLTSTCGATTWLQLSFDCSPITMVSTLSGNEMVVGETVDSTPVVSGPSALPPLTFGLSSESSLPPGLQVESSSGRISGKPTEPGSYLFELVVTAVTGCKGTQTVQFTVNSKPLLSISDSPVKESTPTSTSKPTPTPVKSPTKDLIVINPVCGDNTRVLCPDGKCQSSAEDCRGQPDDGIIVPISRAFSADEVNKVIKVNVLMKTSSGETVAMVLTFEPGFFQPGWSIEITESKEKVDTRLGSDCNKQKSIVSKPISIVIRDKKGRILRKFNKPFELSSFATFADKDDDSVCFASFAEHDSSSSWSCNTKDLTITPTKQKDVKFTKAISEHLTTFAVLLGTTVDKCDKWGWIEITSLILIGCAVLWVVLWSVLYVMYLPFRALLGGYEANQKMSMLVEKMEKKTKEQTSI